MTNQLTELFDMTDTSDVPDEVIAAVCDTAGSIYKPNDFRRDVVAVSSARIMIAFARHITREHPEWIEDPDLATVRELWAAEAERDGVLPYAKDIRAKMHDGMPGMKVRLAAFKAGRAAERAGK